MSSIELVNLLRERALTFLKYSQEMFERGNYDLSMFSLEQASQLYLKALILRLVGYLPKTHSIRQLLAILVKVLKELSKESLATKVQEFSSKYREYLRILDEAYVGARYAPKRYPKEDVEKLLKIVYELKNLVDELESNIFS